MYGESDLEIPIVDCHAHFLDAQLHAYPIFQRPSPGFQALVGDYSSLPRRYLPEQYLKDAVGWNIVGVVCAEIMSVDPFHEVLWLDGLSSGQGYPQGIIVAADFFDPDVESLLRSYSSLKRVKVVRQHLLAIPGHFQHV